MSKKITDSKRELINSIFAEYKPKNGNELDAALNDLFGPMIEDMLNSELDVHLDYEKNKNAGENQKNRRNGTTDKKVVSSKGTIDIAVPRDRDSSFTPEIVRKREKDISNIEDKMISMYARGMSTRDIADTISEIYGFKANKDMITKVTDKIIPRIEQWKNRPLQACYPFVYVDCMYVKMKDGGMIKSVAVYTVLAYTIEGKKDILGFWIADSESTHKWMQIFNELKARGVEEIFFVSMDGLVGLEKGVKSIFPEVIVQRCIVHLIRNSMKFIPSKSYKTFSTDIKKLYSNINLDSAELALEELKIKWKKYPGAVKIWENNFVHVAQLYNYGPDIRRIMYTTNAIEAIHNSYRKVTKSGYFESEKSISKAIYLRIEEIYKKWTDRPVIKWSQVLNQLMVMPEYEQKLIKYLKL